MRFVKNKKPSKRGEVQVVVFALSYEFLS